MLRASFATLAFGGGYSGARRQLGPCDHGLIQIIGDDPVNVAVYGNYLEQSHFESTFLSLTMTPCLSRSSFLGASRWLFCQTDLALRVTPSSAGAIRLLWPQSVRPLGARENGRSSVSAGIFTTAVNQFTTPMPRTSPPSAPLYCSFTISIDRE